MQACILVAALAGVVGCVEPDPPRAEWQSGDGYRSIRLMVAGSGVGFAAIHDSGIDFVGLLSDSAFVQNRHRVNGAGVAIGDVDGDGRPDVFLAGLEGASRLYRNLGAFAFAEMTEEAGVGLAGFYNTGAALLDTDGDFDLDLVVTTLDGPSMLFLNDGNGHFSEDPTWPGLELGPNGGTTITASDIEGDGDLDIYVTNYKRHTVKDLYDPARITFERTVVQDAEDYRVLPPFDEHYRLRLQGSRLMRYEYAESDHFFLNEESGYREATAATLLGEEIAADWGLSAQFRDLDGDGDPDLYVANDFESEDHIWFNNGEGTFSRTPMTTFRHTSQSSMAVDGADIDRDGLTDLFVTEMLSRTHERRLRQVGNPPPIIPGIGEIEVRPQVMHNVLFMSRGRYQPYAEVSRAYQVEASEWSWSGIFLDVDLDGWEDLLITTGHRYDAMDLDAQMARSRTRTTGNPTAELLEFPKLDLPNVAFRNEAGERFSSVPDGWGFGVSDDVTHGMALGDLDGDGDLDLVTNRLNGRAGVFENRSGAPRVAVRLKGLPGNTKGIGALVYLESDEFSQSKEILAGGQYLSGSEAMATFAALSDTMTLVVRWRSGERQVVEGVRPNWLYEIEEQKSNGAPTRAPLIGPPPSPRGISLAAHHDTPFEDRARQPLLTRRLSQEGPYVATGDLDGDGDPDVVIGSGHGGRAAVYRNQEGVLQLLEGAAPTAIGDWAGVAISDGLLLAAVSGYETDRNSEVIVYRLDAAGMLQQSSRLNLGTGSPGPIAMADVDGDGDEDLFVGVRFQPNRYPDSVPSRIYLREGDGFGPGMELDAGMVTGAAFADADGDGDEDLALATEWGTIKLFENDGSGSFRDRSRKWGLSDQVGLWRSVSWGDADGDGRPDLLATNWGWNSPFGRVGAPDYEGRGIRIYWGDFDRNGSVDPVEAEYVPSLRDWAPIMKQMDLVRGLRYVGRRIGSAKEYATSTLAEIVGPALEGAQMSQLNQLGHTFWHNVGGSFEARLLTDEAQWSPSSGSAFLDDDGDGNLDIAMTQNFFPVLPEDATRQDAGTGIVLYGDGMGGFRTGPGSLTLLGDGRDIRAVDLNGDGELELIIGQNAAPAFHYRRNP